MDSDEALYRRVLQGDMVAFELLVERYHAVLFRFLYRCTGHYAIAEDLLQETFTRLIVYNGRPPERFRAWVYTIAGNLARDYLRSAHHRHEIDEMDEMLLEQVTAEVNLRDVDDHLTINDERRTIEQALQQLTPEHRETLILRFYHDLPVDEIAAISGVPSGTVKSRLSYALKRLKGLLTGVGVMK